MAHLLLLSNLTYFLSCTYYFTKLYLQISVWVIPAKQGSILVSMLIQFVLAMLVFKATRHNSQLNYSSTNKILQKLTIPALISNWKPIILPSIKFFPSCQHVTYTLYFKQIFYFFKNSFIWGLFMIYIILICHSG